LRKKISKEGKQETNRKKKYERENRDLKTETDSKTWSVLSIYFNNFMIILQLRRMYGV